MIPLVLFAQNDPNAVPPPNFWAFGGPGFTFALMGLAIVFLFVLPARRQRREQEQMLAALKPGARVVTTGGIIGTVVKVKEGDDELTLRSEDAKIKVLKSSVARVLGEESTDAKG